MSIDLHSVITLPQAEVNESLYEVHLFYSLAWCDGGKSSLFLPRYTYMHVHCI